MEENKYWKVFRVLVTDACNYECIYCHNEGQGSIRKNKNITFEQFVRYYNIALKSGIEEVRFSGGEPLINPDVMRMIEWLESNSDVEIGLATNGSLVTEKTASILGQTRTMVTLHFPGVGDEKYGMVTKRKWSCFERCVALFDKYNVDYSFNFTMYPEINESVYDVINYSVKKGKRVKLLPFLDEGFNNYSYNFLQEIIKILDNMDNEKIHYAEDAYYLWKFKNGGAVKIIESPCYNRSMTLCKGYGEIRLLPDLSLLNCIFGQKVRTNNMSDDEILELFISLFKQLKSCPEKKMGAEQNK